jgi:putative glycosyltransferase (TIGR04372 family)
MEFYRYLKNTEMTSPGLLRKILRFVAKPIRHTTIFHYLKARYEGRRTDLSEIRTANQLLHSGNLLLREREDERALKFYIAACTLHSETRWVSGATLLDYASAHPSRFSSEFEPLTAILKDADYVVPDLEIYLLKLALQSAPKKLIEILESIPLERLGYDVSEQLGSEALGIGENALAIKLYRHALQLRPDNLALRRQLGVTEFLTRNYSEAETVFASADHQKQSEQMRWGVSDSPYRILDKTWIPAIGHVAFLDTFIKTVQLGWVPNKESILVYDQSSPPAGWPLFKFFSKHITIIPTNIPVDEKIDLLVFGDNALRLPEPSRFHRRSALSQPFWYGPDGNAQIRWYAPWGAAVEAAWKADKRSPLFSLSTEERASFRKRMAELYGLPEDAWFVLLHVREPGFHSGWHKHHAGTRNADIQSYVSIVDFVISQGGWVVRGGDPSMTPFSPHERVIDYATSPNRSPEIDIYLCAECAYFVGTNSGFSLVPPVFGKRCALTNWSPIGIPNWYLDDIYIPKLVRKVSENRLLTYGEIYDSFAGWSQFARDFEKSDFVIEENSAEDLREAVEELHEEVFEKTLEIAPEDRQRLQRFNEISLARGGYVGSRMSYRFLKKYQQLLELPTPPA